MTLDNAVLYTISRSALSSGSSLCALAGQVVTASSSRCVITVVGASMQDQTAMEKRASELGPTADVYSRAGLVTLAARENAQRFAGLVAMLGAEVELLDPMLHAPITRGNPLEAEPRLLNAKRFEASSLAARVLVLAGGVGRSADGHLTSLGTGGATLSGLFIAQRLGVPARVVVGGSGAGLPRRADLFARRHGLDFDVVSAVGDLEGGVRQAVPA